VKFFSEAEKALRRNFVEESTNLFAADKWEIVCEVLGRIRSRIAEMQLTANRTTRFLVTDFRTASTPRKINGMPSIIRSRVQKRKTWRSWKLAS
jgi:hypothetical protein